MSNAFEHYLSKDRRAQAVIAARIRAVAELPVLPGPALEPGDEVVLAMPGMRSLRRQWGSGVPAFMAVVPHRT